MSAPKPAELVKVLPDLLRRVPAKIRGWLYLTLAVVAVVFVLVTAWRDGLSSDQIVALIVAFVSGTARANVK